MSEPRCSNGYYPFLGIASEQIILISLPKNTNNIVQLLSGYYGLLLLISATSFRILRIIIVDSTTSFRILRIMIVDSKVD